MDNRCIGVFDSGLGGLTCVREIMKVLPQETIVYFGDTGRVPYGSRSRETIIKYTESDIRFLMEFDPKLIVMACGTASTVALEAVKSKFDVNLMGVVTPAAVSAVHRTRNGKIGVIGTQGSIRSGKYEQYIKSLCPDAEVVSNPCPLFVPLVENGYLEGTVTRLIAEEYLEPLLKAGVDTVILGCTHYPLIKKVIGETVGPEVALIDPGKETARHIKDTIDAGEIDPAGETAGNCRYYVSDTVCEFPHIASLFLKRNIEEEVHLVEIEKYMR